MKVNFDLNKENVNNSSKKVAFNGYKFSKSPDGVRQWEVTCPFDQDRYDCFVEVYKLGKDFDGNYYTTGRAYTNQKHEMYRVSPEGTKIDLYNTFGIEDNQPFAYHFVLFDKWRNHKKTVIDAGDIIDNGNEINGVRQRFNVVTPTTSDLSRGGSMKLVIVDSQNVGWKYNDKNMIVKDERLQKRAENDVKTLTNKLGGTLAGLEKSLIDGDFDSYRRIISLPLFTDDDFSAHAYWNKNCMQMASSLGNINNYSSFQRKMFAKGLNFVSDGAFVNEGLEGVHFKNMLKWGEKSPYFNWFKAGNLKNNPLSLGIFSKNKEFIGVRVVNHPAQNSYDAKTPTYLQFFDKRLVRDEQLRDTQHLLKPEDLKNSTDNVYKLHTHNDSIYPYYFEIDPKVYDKNLKWLKEFNRDNPYRNNNLNDYFAASILSKAENYNVDGKFESGFETWDANPDIAKLNFVFSNSDVKDLKNIPSKYRNQEIEKRVRGNWQVQDYAVTSGQYWTQKTDDILRLYTAQNLKNIDVDNPNKVYREIMQKANGVNLPKSIRAEVSREEIENVIDGYYEDKRKLSEGSKSSQILEGLMNMPLDTIEFGDNLTAVLASPLVSKRANTKDEIGVSRYELFLNGNKNLPDEYKATYLKTENIYKKQMLGYATSILNNIDKMQPEDNKLFDGNKVTEFGQYVLPLLLPEIAKFATVKSLVPNVRVNINEKNGEISYDYKQLKNTHLESINVKNAINPTDETMMVLNRLEKGLNSLKSDNNSAQQLIFALSKMLDGTSLESFKLADLIIDKTQAGLDWRIDATKDIADAEGLRCKNQDFEKTWQNVIDFWAKFNKGVMEKNSNAYMVAEVTDEGALHSLGYGGNSSKFHNSDSIMKKFLRETGMTSTAHYNYFFNDIPMIFSQKFEDGTAYGAQDYKNRQLKIGDIFDVNKGGYLRSGTLDSIIHSYTFIGNHDKPRALHGAALDMNLFYTNLNDCGNVKAREKAYRYMYDQFDGQEIPKYVLDNTDFSTSSPKAIAMAELLRPTFIDVLNVYRNRYPELLGSQDKFDNAFIALSKSVCDLTQGNSVKGHFDPDAFGIKPIDVNIKMVLEQARVKYGLNLPENVEQNFEKDVFDSALRPALSKVLAMMKYLVALPGTPTLFDGDDRGATGYDEKTKNIYLQCRQKVHEEWTEAGPAYKRLIDEFKGYFDEVMAVRANPKCNALNNGDVHLLPYQKSREGVSVPTILRKSTDGKMAISLFNTSNLKNHFREENRQDTITLDRINIDGDGSEWGVNGLRQGLKFVNANDENDIYYSRVDHNGWHYIAHHVNGRDCDIKIKDSTLILYHVPENSQLTFTGNYKPSSKFVTNAYANLSK